MASGDFDIKFFSFTDSDAYYKGDVASGSADASARIYLEAISNLPQDMITFEADDSGLLKPFRSTLGVESVAGKILSSSTDFATVVTGSAFASMSGLLMSGSLQNLKNLQMISTIDRSKDNIDNILIVGPDKLTFQMTNKSPIPENETKKASIDEIESLFYDKRLSRIPNFKFMPPVNKSGSSRSRSQIGDFDNLSQGEILSFSQLEMDLSGRDSRQVSFSRTSPENNLSIQFFDQRYDSLLKLDAIDFGEFLDDNIIKRVFFVGKVFVDSFGSHTFVNLFTLIFE